MRINVKILQGADYSPDINENASVHELKCVLASECNIPIERQRLVFKGKPLQDGMTLLHYGVTPDSRIFLSVKDSEAATDPAASSASKTSVASAGGASCSSTPLELQKELRALLLKHFTPADADKVSEEFHRDLKTMISSLSLDDIEHLARANLCKSLTS